MIVNRAANASARRLKRQARVTRDDDYDIAQVIILEQPSAVTWEIVYFWCLCYSMVLIGREGSTLEPYKSTNLLKATLFGDLKPYLIWLNGLYLLHSLRK